MLEAQITPNCLEQYNGSAVTNTIRKNDIPCSGSHKTGRIYEGAQYISKSFYTGNVLYITFDRFVFIRHNGGNPVDSKGNPFYGYPFFGGASSGSFSCAFKEALVHVFTDMNPVSPLVSKMIIKMQIPHCWKSIVYSYLVKKKKLIDGDSVDVDDYWASCTELVACSDPEGYNCCEIDYKLSNISMTDHDSSIYVVKDNVNIQTPVICYSNDQNKCNDVCSNSNIFFDWAQTTLTRNHYTDDGQMFNIRYDSNHNRISSDELNQAGEYILILPNPTEDFSTVNVFSEKKGIVRLKIHTIAGLQIFDFQGEKSDGLFTNQIDLSTFPSGVYFINVYLNEEFIGYRKIIKQ